MADVPFFSNDGALEMAKPFGNAGDFGTPDEYDVGIPFSVSQLGEKRGIKRLIEDEDALMGEHEPVEEGNAENRQFRGIKRKRRKKRAIPATQSEKNALMILNEVKPGLDYVTSSQQGPPHAPSFVVTVVVDGQVYEGVGTSKQKAKHDAAEKILRAITQIESKPVVVAPDTTNVDQSLDFTIIQQEGRIIATEDRSSKQPTMLLNELHEGKLDYQFDEDHSQQEPFMCKVQVQDKEFTGSGVSKKKAKMAMAAKILEEVYGMPTLISTSMNTSQSLDATTQLPSGKGVITDEDKSKQPVMLLNELHEGKLEYQFEEDHSQQEPFMCTVEVQGREFTSSGMSKKKAKLVVASKVLGEIFGISTHYAGPLPSAPNSGHPTVQSLPPPPETQLQQKVADTVAQMTLDKFKELSLQNVVLRAQGFRRKVLAGIVMTIRKEDGELQYEVISIGTGTKFIGGEYISEKGYAINDCHGEIIARRGLRRFLFSQLEAYLKGEIDSSIVEKKESGLFGLKKGIEFHLYISTSPCGDARVFSPHEGGAGEVDKHSLRKKRGILRVKLENGEGTIPVANYDTTVQTWDGVLGNEKLRTMSCSDKISKWNVLGIQGALLSNFMEPTYLCSIILGSLYRYDHMSRAMYARLGSIHNLPQSYNQHQPLMNSVSFPETRQPGKSPKNSVNWVTGDKNLENICTLTGKLMETTQPSRLCKQAMFARFSALWSKINPKKKPPITYHDAKITSKDYQQAKELMVSAFNASGLGAWLKKPVEQDWFDIIGSP